MYLYFKYHVFFIFVLGLFACFDSCFTNKGFIQLTDILYLLLSVCPAEQMFWEVMRLRREMTVAKLGFYLTDQG